MTYKLIPLFFAGCLLTFCHAADLPDTVTFSEHVAPIIFDNCAECHRPDTAAPFSLTSYAAVRKRAKTIRAVTEEGYMPPWHPVEGHGVFKDSRQLTKEQLALIDRWVETGMKQGDPAKTPKLPTYPGGWTLGKPDMVVKMAKGYAVPADGPDIYRNFVIPLDLQEDKWVTGIEIRPSARQVLHHCLYFLDDTGLARKADGKDGKPGFKRMDLARAGKLGGWAVGGTPRLLDEGLAMPLQKGADLILSTHFHPSGKEETEQTTVALYFADKPPVRVPVELQIPPNYGRKAGLNIPAGAKDFRIEGRFVAPMDMDLISISAHAHYLGKEMRSWAVRPDGSTQKLLYIDEWDFNWQGVYYYEEPVRIKKGTVIHGIASFDNSAENPFNQFDPPQRIRWGKESTDEMGSIIMEVVPADPARAAALNTAIRAHHRTPKGNGFGNVQIADGKQGEGRRLLAQLKSLDLNGDSVIEASEMPAKHKARILKLDRNGDGKVQKSEAMTLVNRDGNR